MRISDVEKLDIAKLERAATGMTALEQAAAMRAANGMSPIEQAAVAELRRRDSILPGGYYHRDFDSVLQIARTTLRPGRRLFDAFGGF
jgi:hypothetical protein